jgi:hypothetical protein
MTNLMSVKRLARQPGQIETLNFHAAVGVPVPGEQRSISDPERIEATLSEFGAGLRDSLATPSRIRGWISDQLFGLIAADLNGCLLVKQEDTGVLFYADDVKLPDWRLTLTSGESILVEVKSVDDSVPRVAKFRLAEIRRLKRYAALSDLKLFIAVNWVSLNQWSLVPVEELAVVDSHYEISLIEALKQDHMGSLLNDQMLGLVPPLEFRMTLEESRETDRQVSPDGDAESVSSKLSLTVKSVQTFGGGQEMLDEQEQSLVWFLVLHASWPIEETMSELGNGIWEMKFVMTPDELIEGQRFAIIGRLSELYTRMFVSSTTSTDENATTQLTIDIEPGTLPRLVPTTFKSKRLPLWRFRVSPAGDGCSS